MAQKIYVLTNEYEFSHGKKPRAGGAGWLFDIELITDPRGDGHFASSKCFEGYSYSECLRNAKAWVKSLSSVTEATISVLP